MPWVMPTWAMQNCAFTHNTSSTYDYILSTSLVKRLNTSHYTFLLQRPRPPSSIHPLRFLWTTLSFCAPPAHLDRHIKFNVYLPILFFFCCFFFPQGPHGGKPSTNHTRLLNGKHTTCCWSGDKKRNALPCWGGKPEVFRSLLSCAQSQALHESTPPPPKHRFVPGLANPPPLGKGRMQCGYSNSLWLMSREPSLKFLYNPSQTSWGHQAATQGEFWSLEPEWHEFLLLRALPCPNYSLNHMGVCSTVSVTTTEDLSPCFLVLRN